MARSMLPLRRLMLLGLLGPAGLALPSVAAANPAVQACEGKAQGDPCGLMKMVKPEGGGELEEQTVPGACRSDECCDLDYSKGSPPQSVCHTCLACKEGPADVTPPNRDGDGNDGPSAEPPRANGDQPPVHSPGEKRGCSVGSPGEPMAGLLMLLGLWAIGRRR